MASTAAVLPRSSPGKLLPILVYHRFGPAVADSMTVRTSTLRSQMASIQSCGLRPVALEDAVSRLISADLQDALIAVTADDGHRSIYSEMWPVMRQFRIPLTLFVYPSAISNASYAATWTELREMVSGGGVSIGSHTYWHPNFRHEKLRLAPEAYRKFVSMQFTRSKEELEQRLSTRVNLIAWPFGIYDEELIAMASEAGYTGGFTIERRPASATDRIMALPRLLMTDADSGARFERLIGGK